MKLHQLLNEDDDHIDVENGCIISKHDKIYDGSFRCFDQGLTTLDGCPEEVNGFFAAQRNKLTSLKGAPKKVSHNFSCSENKLTSLEHCPKEVGGFFNCEQNRLTSLEGIHKHLKRFLGGNGSGIIYAKHNPIESHILGLFLIDNCQGLFLDNPEVQKLVNRYLPRGRDGLIDCQNALIEAGFEDYAQI